MIPVGLQNILNVYSLDENREDGTVKYRLVGKILLTDEVIEVLYDPHKLLQNLHGETTPERLLALQSLRKNPYYHVVDLQEIRDGHHPELLEEKNVPELTGIPDRDSCTNFEYLRHGLENPLLIQFKEGKAYLNGQLLTRLELQQLCDTVSAGQAEIRRYSQGQEAIAKMEKKFQDLTKIEPHLQRALGNLKGAVDDETYKTVMKEIFADPMIPEMGGKKAWAHFQEQPRGGVHARIDLNSFGAINKVHSFEHGDQAIKSAAKALLDAKREADGKFAPPKEQIQTIGADANRDLEDLLQSKTFRLGGDEFAVHIPDHPKAFEHAAYFLRKFREKMDSIPPIGGTHRISASVGLGHTPEESDQAQIHAKRAKQGTGRLPGQEDTHVHSLLHGHEGPVPVADAPTRMPEPAEVPKVA